MENDFFFPPYIGELYGKPDNFFNGKKVLVIGNSHYCDYGYPTNSDGTSNREIGCSECPNRFVENVCPNSNHSWTWDAISDSKDLKNFSQAQKEKLTTYLKFAIIMEENFRRQGNLKENKSYLTFWESVAFYNFLQVAVPSNDSQGTPSEIEKSKEILNNLFPFMGSKYSLPDIIIVLGKGNVFNHFLDLSNFELIQDRLGKFKYKEKEILIICINHPSRCGYATERARIKGFTPELFPDCQ